MKYFFVTYCVMDQQIANTNPFWHACIMLSSSSDLNTPLQVKHIWGYYSTTPISNPNSIYGRIKRALGFHFDLLGAFGQLKNEEMRHFDLGKGLHGRTFEINQDQYNTLKQSCKNKIAAQLNAYADAREYLAPTDQEPTLLELFNEEEKSAFYENRDSRLGRFEICLSVDSHGISLEDSYTCKTHALNLLEEVGIEKSFLHEIKGNRLCAPFPKVSGVMEDIYLYSTGPRSQHRSQRTHKISFFPEWSPDKKNKLYWSFPPQCIHYLKPENYFYILASNSIPTIKKCISKLQQLEYLILHAQIQPEFEEHRQVLVSTISRLYQAFATLHAENDQANVLNDTIHSATTLFHSMYDAIHHRFYDDTQIASLASQFKEDEQSEVCNILGKAYPFWESYLPMLA